MRSYKGFLNVLILCAIVSVIPSAVSANSNSSYYFATDRSIGYTGMDTLQLQKYLNAHGFVLASTGAGSPGHETEYYGTRTFNALVAFQEAHAIPILVPIGTLKGTGFFGPLTRAYINGQIAASVATSSAVSDISVATSVPEVVPSQSPAPTSTSSPSSSSLHLPLPALPVPKFSGGVSVVTSPAPVISVSVMGSSTALDPFATTTFSATVLNASDDSVTWSASGGSINASGTYTAPSPNATTTYTITATSVADGSRSGSATVTVSPIIVTITPTSTEILAGNTETFSASVMNASTSSVTWSASGGSINASGIFVAPAVTTTTLYTITASSTADASRAATATVQVDPNTNFVGLWKLNEGTGTVAYDTSGGGNDGTWSGTPSGNTGYYDTGAATGFSYAGAFNGSNDLVTIPNINISAAETISFWAYIPSLSGLQELVSKSAAGQGVEFLISGNTMTFYVMGSAVNDAVANASDIHLNAWNYITGTYNGPNSVVTLYINGVQSGATTTAPSSIGNVQNLYFGNWTSGGRWFTGKLNDVRMYTNEFTPQQVQDLYNSYGN